jgi:hypothetical protein
VSPNPTRSEARERAKDLLFSWLTPEQKTTAEVHRYFDVVGNSSGRTYRIYMHTITNNVKELDKHGRGVRTHCCYPMDTGAIPEYDTFLAQALSITANEREWLRVAVSSPAIAGVFPDTIVGDAAAGIYVDAPRAYTYDDIARMSMQEYQNFRSNLLRDITNLRDIANHRFH